MITTLEPASVTSKGSGTSATVDQPSGPADFNFDFTFVISDPEQGNVDLLIDTLLGQRILFGKFAIFIDQVSAARFLKPLSLRATSHPQFHTRAAFAQVPCALNTAALCRRGVGLRLALGTSRPPSPLPSATSAVLDAEASYVYLTAFRTAHYHPPDPAPPAPGADFEPGSCLHRVQAGETLDSIALAYRLLWQDLFAFNPALPAPADLRPGDVIAVGRHHTVRGPCLPDCRRQVDAAGATEADASCMRAGQCITCDWATAPELCGETLYGVASRYGTSWRRVLDMNPQLLARCAAAGAAGVPGDGSGCVLTPGARVCVVPWLRNAVCGQEYRRYPVTDARGAGWESLGRLFTCSPVWNAAALADKCCHVPRCRCCTADGTDGGAPTAAGCSAAPAVTACAADPSSPACTDDCTCVAGFVPLVAADPATGDVRTSCLLAKQCRTCVDPAQTPPRCAVCAKAL